MDTPKNLGITILRPIIVITSILAITPSFNFKTGEHKTNRIYTYLILTILISSTFYSFYGYYLYKSPNDYATYYVLSVAFYGLLSFTNIYTCIRLRRGSKLGNLIRQFIEIDKRLNLTILKPDIIKLYTQSFAYVTFCVIYIIVDEIRQSLIDGSTFYFHEFTKKPQTLLAIILAMLVYKIATCFKQRFRILNEKLDRFRHQANVFYMKQPQNRWNIYEIYQCFMKLSEMVEVFNGIFGWHIVNLSGCMVFGLLYTINYGIVGIQTSRADLQMWMNWAFYSSCMLVFCVPLAISCNGAAEEARYTSVLAYAILAQIEDKNESRQREKLQLLAVTNPPTFSAADFFIADHTMLFTLFGAVTSYLIVLIQLKDMHI